MNKFFLNEKQPAQILNKNSQKNQTRIFLNQITFLTSFFCKKFD